MTGKQKIRGLLVEDDEDDYRIIKDTLSNIQYMDFSLDWASETDIVKDMTQNKEYDICLIDYRLGEMTGIELMEYLFEIGFRAPIILLTGYGDREVDLLAMKSGAADYIEKGSISPGMLERAIRYAIERKRHIDALRISEQHLRALSSKLVNAQEEERRRVAKEIHDGIGSNLVAIKYGLESILVRMEQKRSYHGGVSIEKILDYVKDTIEEAQRISSDLSPSILDDIGLYAAVRWICRRYQDICPGIRIQEHLEPREIDVDEPLRMVVFRVLQEAMNNVFKHSKADTLHLNVIKTDDQLLLTVEDNGEGFEVEEKSGEGSWAGMGLMGMVERVELSGGSLKISSEKGKGCVINAAWDLMELQK